MKLRGCRDREVVSVCHHHESFKILNRGVQHPSCPHKSISSFHLLAVRTPDGVCAKTHSNILESRGTNQCHYEQSLRSQCRAWPPLCPPKPWSGPGVEVKFQRDCSSCSSTMEQKAKPFSPSVCVFRPDLSLCQVCGSPNCEWSLLVVPVFTVCNGRVVGERVLSQHYKDPSC